MRLIEFNFALFKKLLGPNKLSYMFLDSFRTTNIYIEHCLTIKHLLGLEEAIVNLVGESVRLISMHKKHVEVLK